MSQDGKQSFKKTHKVLAGIKECQLKILRDKLASFGTQRGKQAGVLNSDTLRSPGRGKHVEENQ